MNTHRSVLVLILASMMVMPLAGSGQASALSSTNCGTTTEIGSNFNGNAIDGGNVIWFNSNMKLTSPVPSGGLTIYFTGQTVTGNDFSKPVPDSEVIFSPTATSATTSFDTTNNMWVTTVPAGFGDDVFLSGFHYYVPASGLPAGEQVTWSGTISGSAPFSMSWKWGAAVYTSFGGYNQIGVKPVHSTSLDSYPNGDQAGTPENEKSFVVGGARGGGGSNWTGSWSSTVSASSDCTTPPAPPVTLAVNTEFENGTALPGMYVELQDTSGNDIDTGFSPVSFSVNSGQQYTVVVNDFNCDTFASWQDTGSTSNARPISITSDTSITALYTVNCGSGGGSGGGTGGSGGGTGGGPPPNCGTETSIASNFNGNSIAGGDTIWFNSNMKLTSPVPSGGLTVFFTGQTVTSGDLTSSVPDSEVIFSPTATSATTSFDTTNNMWVTTVPAGFGDDVFLSGLHFNVPSSGIPGGENPVTWSGTISGSAPFSMSWKWGSAVYTSFGDYNDIGVKPVHSTSLDAYPGGDQAGTPENEKSFVVGGARGGGGSNWTGSWSATAAAESSCEPSPSGQVFLNVNDMDLNGNVLTGYAVELKDTSGTTIDTEYSPATLTLNAGQSYQIEADSFGTCTFDHWDDTGSASDTRDISIQADTSLTAVFNCG